jgi:drug/metabolite transporter (DMT)-like permease
MIQAQIKQSMGPVEWAMVIALSVVWGSSFFTVGIAIKELPPLTIVVARVGLAAIGLWAFAVLAGIKIPRDGKVWAAFFGMGLLNNAVPFTLIVWGQQHIASGLASILNATTPFFAVLVANALTSDEKISGGKIAGVLVGLCGVVWMIGGSALAGLGSSVWAQIAILGAAVSYAFAGVFGRRFKTMGVNPVATATGQVTCSSLMLLPIALLVDKPWTLATPGTSTVVSLIVLALVSTSLAYILYFRILEAAGATNLLLVTFLIPPVAIFLGIAFLSEVLEPRHIVGVLLIFAGLVLIDGRLFAKVKARQPE